MTAAVLDSFRDQLAEAMFADHYGYPHSESGVLWDSFRAQYESRADALLPVVAAEVEARVQAAAVQRAAEELELAAVLTVPSQDTSEEVREALLRRADDLRAGAAVVAQPTTGATS